MASFDRSRPIIEPQFRYTSQPRAGVAQLVESNLAKVEVASSRLVSRSKFLMRGKPARFPFLIEMMAGWQSGHAADCKSVYAGSIPTPASTAVAIRLSKRDQEATWSTTTSSMKRGTT